MKIKTKKDGRKEKEVLFEVKKKGKPVDLDIYGNPVYKK